MNLLAKSLTYVLLLYKHKLKYKQEFVLRVKPTGRHTDRWDRLQYVRIFSKSVDINRDNNANMT